MRCLDFGLSIFIRENNLICEHILFLCGWKKYLLQQIPDQLIGDKEMRNLVSGNHHHSRNAFVFAVGVD